ncbi:MAG: pilus assembly protein PilM [bacterium]|nr:pilus assembly protein PilM [bacterium]
MFDRLKAMFGSLTSKGDSVVGVDVGSAYLKVVQLRRKNGKAILETYGSLALGPYAGVEIGRATHLPAGKLAEALRDLLREAHVTTKKAGCSIPFASSLVTTMDMRVLDPKQLATSVSLEARKYIPVPISEVNLDWWIIPEEPGRISVAETPVGKPEQPPEASAEGQGGSSAPTAQKERVNDIDPNAPRETKILIAAIHNEELARFQGAMRDGGLEVSFFEIELFSTIRSLFSQDLEPHAVLDLGAGETKLYIIDRGIVRSSHIMSHGGQDITLALSRSLGITVEEAEKRKREEGLQGSGEETVSETAVLNVIFGEMNRVLGNFERKFGRKVVDVVLSGGGANLLGIEALAQQSLSVAVRRANPFTQVEAPAFLDELLKGVGPEFTVAVGIAFRKLQETT